MITMNNETWCPAVEFSETKTALVLKAEVPGVERKYLNVHVNPDSVAITGIHPHTKRTENLILSELHYGRLQCSVPIQVPVQPKRSQAELINGVLIITIPKLDESKEMHK